MFTKCSKCGKQYMLGDYHECSPSPPIETVLSTPPIAKPNAPKGLKFCPFCGGTVFYGAECGKCGRHSEL
jgi:hypothetical protein